MFLELVGGCLLEACQTNYKIKRVMLIEERNCNFELRIDWRRTNSLKDEFAKIIVAFVKVNNHCKREFAQKDESRFKYLSTSFGHCPGFPRTHLEDDRSGELGCEYVVTGHYPEFNMTLK